MSTVVTAQHGKRWMYRNGCRCDECRRAQVEYGRRYRRRKARARWTGERLMVEADECRAHLAFLRSCGMDCKVIAAETGLHHKTVLRVANGQHRKVLFATHDRIMGVCAPDRDAAPGSRPFDAATFDDADGQALDFTIWPAKTCSECGRVLPANRDYFGRDAYREDGLTSQCRACRVAASRKWDRGRRGRERA